MKRYWLSVLVLAFGLVFAASVTGISFLPFLDLPSFIIAVAVPFLFVTILFGFKETKRAFTILHKNESEHDTLLTALAFFRVYGKATWIFAFIAVITGMIGIMLNMDDKFRIGPNVALALVALLYCGVVQLAIVMPHTVLIRKKLGNSSTRGDIHNIFGSLFGVIFVYILLFLILIQV
jgi:flagellar motor component MotA